MKTWPPALRSVALAAVAMIVLYHEPVARAQSCCALAAGQKPTNAVPLSDRSVYQLNSDWTNDGGVTTKLAGLRGRPQVVAMFFTSCHGACPLLVHEMQQLTASLPADERTNVGFVLVTFDPAHDTPAALHAYRAQQHLDDGQWTLLHGRPDDIRELALVLGLKYRQDGDGQFSHSNLITLLNAEGEIVFQQNGLDAAGDDLAAHLRRLLKP